MANLISNINKDNIYWMIGNFIGSYISTSLMDKLFSYTNSYLFTPSPRAPTLTGRSIEQINQPLQNLSSNQLQELPEPIGQLIIFRPLLPRELPVSCA